MLWNVLSKFERNQTKANVQKLFNQSLGSGIHGFHSRIVDSDVTYKTSLGKIESCTRVREWADRIYGWKSVK